MTDPTGTPRLYDEKEIRTLLRRATELQESEKKPETRTPGLSLSELETLAAELGIDPHHLRTAAVEMESGGPRGDSIPVIRLPRTTRIERTVPGRMPEEVWPMAVQEIRRTFDTNGQVNQLGAAHEWTTRAGMASVSVTPQTEDTRIQVEYRYGPAIVITMIMVAFYTFLGFGATMENLDWAPLVEWMVSGGGFAGIMVLTRQVLSQIIGRHNKKLTKLTDRLDATIRQNTTSSDKQPALGQPESNPAIELPAIESPESEPDHPVRPQTRTTS